MAANVYTPPTRKRSDYQLKAGNDGRTKQSDAEACDINKIMAKYHRTGQLTHISETSPDYGDFSNAVEYQEAKNRMIFADQAFANLSSEVRQRMGQDPGVFLDFMADEANEDEAIALGLINPKVESAPKPPPEGETAPKPVESLVPTGGTDQKEGSP